MTLAGPCVIVLPSASRPLRPSSARLGHGGTDVGERGPGFAGALGAVETRRLVRGGVSARRWAYGTVLSLCGMLLVGCSHSTSPAARSSAPPAVAASSSASQVGASQSASDASWDAAFAAAQVQVAAQVEATDRSQLVALADRWTLQPITGAPVQSAEAQWASAYLDALRTTKPVAPLPQPVVTVTATATATTTVTVTAPAPTPRPDFGKCQALSDAIVPEGPNNTLADTEQRNTIATKCMEGLFP